MKPTLMATLIATVVGTLAWMVGVADRIWPAHPFIAVLILTIATQVLVKYTWAAVASKR